MRKLRAGEKFTIQERTKPGPTGTRKFHTWRPRPAELYPFVANIKMEKHLPDAARVSKVQQPLGRFRCVRTQRRGQEDLP